MESESATILLHRRPSLVQPALAYKVEVDERPSARLWAGQRQAVNASPGRHKIQAKVLWMSSPSLTVEVEAGQSQTVTIAPDVRHIWNMFLRPNHFLRVEPLSTSS